MQLQDRSVAEFDLALESLPLLARIEPGSGERNSAPPPGDTRWSEEPSPASDLWLEELAENGDTYAMQRLSERPDGDERTSWLREAAARGNLQAQEKLANEMLEGDVAPRYPGEAEALLRSAVAQGYVPAMINLGLRLTAGLGLTAEPHEGRRLLFAAAGLGDRLAMALAARSAPPDIPAREQAGWLVRAGARSPQNAYRLGPYVYLRGIAASSPALQAYVTAQAAALFLEGVSQRDPASSQILAYLVRRGEAPEAEYPGLDELLLPFVRQRRAFAVVNQALRLATGVQADVDWRQADDLIASLPGSHGVLDWWLARARAGDVEGHLVLAWLLRHALTTDPGGLRIEQRFELAQKGPFAVPGWLVERAS